MYVLGIETSCDETSVAVVKDGKDILSNEVSSSVNFHRKYGGVVPEIASRMQLESIARVARLAIKKTKPELKLKDMDLISVTNGPGLLGSLLVGISFAKGISLSLGIPILGANHLYSHIYANFLNIKEAPDLPFVALIISGGHTSLFYLEDFNKIKILGSTEDDACGEAFDKVAKILGWGYPGGPLIEALSRKGNCRKFKFSCSNTRMPLDFSFSGIKTAVLYLARNRQLRLDEKRNIAASFQETVINTLIKKSFLACQLRRVRRLAIGGGVAANSRLRELFQQEAEAREIKCFFPSRELCLDNAAMVAGLGYRLFQKGLRSDLSLREN